MQCRDAVMVGRVGIEAADEHGLEDARIAALGGDVHHEVMFCSKLVSEIRVLREHVPRTRTIAPRTRGYEVFKRRELVIGAVREEPFGDFLVSVERGDGVRRAAVRPAPMDVRSM